MNRITYIELAGKMYPMSFSLAASKAIAAKYGDITKLGEILTLNRFGEKEIETILDIIAILIAQGTAYKNLFEKELPPHEMADVRDGKLYAIKKEEIEVALGFSGIESAVQSIVGCISESNKTEIEVETKGKK